jgi:hypothetical protein
MLASRSGSAVGVFVGGWVGGAVGLGVAVPVALGVADAVGVPVEVGGVVGLGVVVLVTVGVADAVGVSVELGVVVFVGESAVGDGVASVAVTVLPAVAVACGAAMPIGSGRPARLTPGPVDAWTACMRPGLGAASASAALAINSKNTVNHVIAL